VQDILLSPVMRDFFIGRWIKRKIVILNKYFFMSVTEVKEHLHRVINEIEDEEVLKAVLTILESKKDGSNKYQLDDEQMNVLREREEQYLSGKMKSSSTDEVTSKLFAKFE
jgi:hypothetical protein